MYEITIREDIISPWYDVSHDGIHWASFKTRREAEDYINGTDDPFEEWTIGPCGCVDYHYSDCGLGSEI